MKLLHLLFILIGISACSLAQNTNISGTINNYTSINAISGNLLTVSSSAGFSVGDKVLLIQMQGAGMNETNSSAFGDVNSFGNAGNYEFATVCNINSSTEIMLNDIQRTYTPSENAQLVYVPVYNDATITGTLTAPAWDGTTGGVLAFECTGTLTMNNGIDLQGSGFRGGAVTTSTHSCSWISPVTGYFYDLSTGEGAKKGEGVALYIAGKTGGRGAQTNGGGGGNDHNSGGGGGGNIGAGGQGGERIKLGAFYCGGQSPGVGGKLNPYSNTANKIFMGGGGGAGHENNANTATPGSNGGGIVIIKANNINAGGQTINVKGGPTPGNSIDGGGGGGAGGSVLLSVASYSGTMNINASGSSGGNVSNVGTSNCNGPGGGGGGGMLWVNQATTPVNISLNNAGAPSGTTIATSQTNCTVGSTNNALSGNNGATVFGLALFESNCNATPVNITAAICKLDSIFLGGSWQYAPGIYYDTLSSGCCDTIYITTLTINDTSYGAISNTICAGDSLFLQGAWQATNGTYLDSFQTSNGCDSIVETILAVNPPLAGFLSQTICNGDSIVVNGTTYNSSIVASEIFTNIGPYNCDSTVTIDLTVLPELMGSVTSTICADESIVVNGNTYHAANPTGTEVFTNVGPYNCDSTVTIDLTVINIDTSVAINANTLMAIISAGNYQWLDCSNNFSIIIGETNQSYTASTNGVYAVKITQSGCIDTSSCFAITILSVIENTFEQEIRVSPCPTVGKTTIDLGTEHEKVSIIISDIAGKVIHTKEFNQMQHLDFIIPGPAGIYLLQVNASNNGALIRIIKQ